MWRVLRCSRWRRHQPSQLRRSSIVAPIVPLFTRRGTGTIWRFLISILADSGFPADQKLEPAVAVGQLARCPRSQVPAGGRFSPSLPVTLQQRRTTLRSKVTTGRRETESCRRPPRGKCRVLQSLCSTDCSHGFTGAWELGAGTELYRWEQSRGNFTASTHNTFS